MPTKQQTRQLLELIQVAMDSPIEEMMTPEFRQVLKQLRNLADGGVQEQRDHLREQDRRDWELRARQLLRLQKEWAEKYPKEWASLSPVAQKEVRELEKLAKLADLKVWRVQGGSVVPEGYEVEPGMVIPVTEVVVPRALLRRLLSAPLQDLTEALQELIPYVESADEPSEP